MNKFKHINSHKDYKMNHINKMNHISKINIKTKNINSNNASIFTTLLHTIYIYIYIAIKLSDQPLAI